MLSLADMITAARLFQSHDLDDLADAFEAEDAPRDGRRAAQGPDQPRREPERHRAGP